MAWERKILSTLVSKIILVFKNSSIFRARQRQGQVEMGATKRSRTPVNRFPFMAGANAWGKNRFLPMLMNSPFSSFGLPLPTGHGIKISLPFSNASPEGSNPVLQVRTTILNKDKAEEMIQKNWVYDITKVKTLLGFESRVPLSKGAKLTFKWYKKEKWL